MKTGGMVPVEFSLGRNYRTEIFTEGYPISKQITCDTQAVTCVLLGHE
jgi:hypothetical protein